MKTLTHYTSLLNAFRILISKRVKMSNISNANDYLEKNSINGEFRTMMTFAVQKWNLVSLCGLAIPVEKTEPQ